MTLPRDYTLAEIDAMRKIVKRKLADELGGLSYVSLNPRQVEDRLRTYMTAGVTLSDLHGGVAKEADPFLDVYDPDYEKIAK